MHTTAWMPQNVIPPSLLGADIFSAVHRGELVCCASRECERAGAIPLAKRQVRALKQLLAEGPAGMDALEPDLLTDLQSGLLQIQVQFDDP